jgi:hypothetical protein
VRFITLAVLIAFLLLLSACGTVVSMKPPSVLKPIPSGMAVNGDVTDYDVLWFSDQVYQVFSTRAFRAEAGDLGGAVAESSLATGATIASGSGATPAAIAMLVAIGNWIASVNTLVNPQLRATILSEGGGLILDAQTVYFQERTAAGIQKTSHKVLTTFGAKFLGAVNSSVRVTSGLLAGMAPRFSDYQRLQPVNVVMPTPTPTQVNAINSEQPAVVP